MKVVALIDGEHYPPVTRWGLEEARARGFDVVAALVMGGVEKLASDRSLDLGSTPVLAAEGDGRASLADALEAHGAEGVLDLSDEPVLSYGRRMELIAVTLAGGRTYQGPDFRFDPPITEPPLAAPAFAVIGVGKRVAKTALGGHAARLAAAAGLRPVLVAMGRGGPPAPVQTVAGDVTLQALMRRVDEGEHAASDFLEDALTAGIPTIGARRCGGGLAGRPFATNVAEAARTAASGGAGLVILEGSGASVPTVPWDAGLLVVPSTLPPEYLGGYLGPLRLLLSDLVVFIIGAGLSVGPDDLSTLESLARRPRADIRVVLAELQPVPLADVRGKDAFFATTAQHDVASSLAVTLERTAGCRVVAVSSRLADRAGLEVDLAEAPPFDVLLTELKAAAVDVAARRALERGAEVVFVDNRPVGVGGDGELDAMVSQVLEMAMQRGTERLNKGGT